LTLLQAQNKNMKKTPSLGTKATLLIGSTLTVMSAAVIAPSLPQMAVAFGGDEEATLLSKTILTAPAIAIAFFSLIAGWLLDRLGRLKIFFVALVLYALAGSAGLYLMEPSHFLLSRGLFGIMVAIVMTATTTLVGDYFEGEKRNKFIGFQSAMMAFGAAALVGLAGILADINWRYPFGVYLASLLVLALGVKYLWEPQVVHKEAANRGQASAQDQLPFWPAFLVYTATFIGLLIFYLIPTQSTFLFKEMGVESNLIASGGLIIATLAAAAIALNYAFFKRLMTYPQIYVLCFIMMGTGFLLVFLGKSIVTVMLAFIITGAGSGFFMPNASLCLMHISPPTLRGRAIGGMVSAAFLGQFLSPLAFEPVLQATSLSESFLWGAIASLGIGVVFLFVKLK